MTRREIVQTVAAIALLVAWLVGVAVLLSGMTDDWRRSLSWLFTAAAGAAGIAGFSLGAGVFKLRRERQR